MEEKKIDMDIMDINLKLRSDILEYSLNLEKSINDLLLASLGIWAGSNATRLFGGKAGITFKNKIDLLCDIDVLSKDENSDLELLMVFRNKFLHLIDCNSFKSVLEQLDNSLKNKFKRYLPELPKSQSIDDEELYRLACLNLYLKNIGVIKKKLEKKESEINERFEIFQALNQKNIYHIDLFFNFIKDLFSILENSDMTDLKIRNLSKVISAKCQEYVDKYDEDEYVSLNTKCKYFFEDIEKVKKLL